MPAFYPKDRYHSVFAGPPPPALPDRLMDIRFQRAVDKYAGVPLCALFTAWDWGLRKLGLRRKRQGAPQRILVILLSEMGSLVLAEPMFQAIRTRYPEAELHVMLFAKNREVMDLLGVVPPKNVITLNDADLKEFASDLWEAFQKMRALRFDVVIDCELFARVSSLIGYLSGAPVLEPSNRVIRLLRAELGAGFPIIGAGGVLSGADARSKVAAGADGAAVMRTIVRITAVPRRRTHTHRAASVRISP